MKNALLNIRQKKTRQILVMVILSVRLLWLCPRLELVGALKREDIVLMLKKTIFSCNIVFTWIFAGSFWYIHFIVFQSALHGKFVDWMAHCTKVIGSITEGVQKAHKHTCFALCTGNYDLYALVFDSGMYYVIPLQRNRSEPNTWTMPLIQNTACLFHK